MLESNGENRAKIWKLQWEFQWFTSLFFPAPPVVIIFVVLPTPYSYLGCNKERI